MSIVIVVIVVTVVPVVAKSAKGVDIVIFLPQPNQLPGY